MVKHNVGCENGLSEWKSAWHTKEMGKYKIYIIGISEWIVISVIAYMHRFCVTVMIGTNVTGVDIYYSLHAHMLCETDEQNERYLSRNVSTL